MSGFIREKDYVLKRLAYSGPGGDTNLLGRWTSFLLKESLLYGIDGIKNGTYAWTVLGSSDASSWGMDGVDRLTSYLKIVYAGGVMNHAWIVLKQNELGGTNKLQICIDWNYASAYALSLSFSIGAGFTGGELYEAPTATDQVFVVLNSTVFYNQGMNGSCGVNCLKSIDGKSTRLFLSRDSILHTKGMWIMEEIDVESYIPSPVVVGAFPISLSGYSATSNCFMNQNSGSCSGKITSHGTSASLQMAEGSTWSMRPNANGEWQFYPCGLLLDTGPNKGWVGRFHDLWIAPNVFPTGEYFAADEGGYFKYVNIGGLVQPWVGEPLVLP